MNQLPEIPWQLDAPTSKDIEAAETVCSAVFEIRDGRALQWDAVTHRRFKETFEHVFAPSAYMRVDERTIQILSAHHARAWLRLGLVLRNLPGFTIPDDRFNAALNAPFILRGQRDYRWPLRPSLYRRPPGTTARNAIQAREDAERLLRVFEFVLEVHLHAFVGMDDPGLRFTMSKLALRATAQHYGLATPLLDWTTDPDVAITFACGRDVREGPEVSAVYLLPFTELRRFDGRVILPPYFVERLYQQHGLFLDMDEESSTRLDEACLKILLPGTPAPRLRDFLPDDPYFAALVAWARDWAAHGSPLPSTKHDVLALAARADEEMFWSYSAYRPDWVYNCDWVEGTPTDEMDALTFTRAVDLVASVAMRSVEGRLEVNESAIQILLRDNLEFFRELARLDRRYPDLRHNYHDEAARQLFKLAGDRRWRLGIGRVLLGRGWPIRGTLLNRGRFIGPTIRDDQLVLPLHSR